MKNVYTIDLQCPLGKVSQTCDFLEVVQVRIKNKKHKLRIRIHCDSYDFQAYANIEKWSGSTWQKVHNILGKNMKSKGSYTTVEFHNFEEDRKRLLDAAVEILS